MDTRKRMNLILCFALVVCLVIALMPSGVFAQSIDDLILMTEQYPPYNLEVDGKPQGIAVDTLVLMLQNVGSKLTRKNIKVLPWARGYKSVQSQPYTCLFSTTRTKERENLFKWVGPVGINKIVLTAKKERNIKINSPEDLKKYRIGVISEDVAEQLLAELGISKYDMDRVPQTILNIRKLNVGRIDLWGYGEDVAKWEIKTHGFDPGDYETAYVLKSKELYFAFNKETSDALIQKLQKALDEVKKRGDYQKILDKYLK